MNKLINSHRLTPANVPSDGQNKVTEVAHFTRGGRQREAMKRRERGREGGMKAGRGGGGREEGREGANDAEGVNRGDKRVKVSGKMSAEKGKQQKGKAGGCAGARGVYYHKKVRLY